MIAAVDFKPRAIAALVALRGGSLFTGSISNRLADTTTVETLDLLGALCDLGLVTRLGRDRAAWALTHDGIGWCESHGMAVSDEAKIADGSTVAP